ncbi:MAG: hypothetical protein M0009_07465 [Deltaproteobacteria bacterium]|nr:hypothetical protein [Deltaproteobacteria bacterium]
MHRILKTGKGTITLLAVLASLLSPAGLLAWSEHPLVTYPVLNALPEVTGAAPVAVEPIEAFLAAEGEKLAVLLAAEETWAKGHLTWYPPLPESLTFKAGGDPATLRARFCRAIRINPRAAFALYLQQPPGSTAPGGRTLRPAEISFLADTADWAKTAFFAVAPGERLRPLAIAVSASDEPDLLGLDIGLFTDNQTEFGKTYGFGPQPFGNPNLEYGSQAPFHMGFYHEAPIVNLLAGFLKKTLPEYRIHLYKSLARFAFATGHPYWGWRFTGLGLHYLADLAQPYHATVLPGVSTVYALWINTIDMVGVQGPKNDAVQLVSNRHTALEKFVHVVLQRAYGQGETGHPILAALANAPEGLPYSDRAPREVVAKGAHAKADETDRLLEEAMPQKFVSDPAFELGSSPEREQIVERVVQERGQNAADRLTLLARTLLEPFGTSGRGYVRAVLDPSPKEK